MIVEVEVSTCCIENLAAIQRKLFRTATEESREMVRNIEITCPTCNTDWSYQKAEAVDYWRTSDRRLLVDLDGVGGTALWPRTTIAADEGGKE